MNLLRKLNTMSASPDTIKIDFEKITSTYEAGLVDTLRHFGLDAEFLETWVPDPNVAKSIINLADAAIEGKSEADAEKEARADKQEASEAPAAPVVAEKAV